MISPQWSCITGKGLAQDTTQPIATTQREVRALDSVGWGTRKRVGLSTVDCFPFYLHPTGHVGGTYIHTMERIMKIRFRFWTMH